MQVQHMYCGACAQQVRVVITPDSAWSGQAPVANSPEVVCLDFGTSCGGPTCPLTGLPTVLMGVALEESGFADEAQAFRGPCRGCEQVVDFEILDAKYAVCPICAARHRWLRFHLDHGVYLALAEDTE